MRTHFLRNPERSARDRVRLCRIVVDPATSADPGLHQPPCRIGVSVHEILSKAERAVAEVGNEIRDVDYGSRVELLLGNSVGWRICKDCIDQPLAENLGLIG